MVQKVFVFGTLKRGFPHHEQGLSDAKFLAEYRTRERYPLLVAGPWFAPMMLNEAGIGCQIVGELYEADDITIKNLDQLESVGEPGNFRMSIEVEPAQGGSSSLALVYMKAGERAHPVDQSKKAEFILDFLQSLQSSQQPCRRLPATGSAAHRYRR